MHVDLGGYHISDIEFTAAFDVVKGKVGVDLADAIWAHPNDTIKFADVKKTGVTVSRGMTHDGIGKYLAEVTEKAPGDTDDVVGILKETGTDVVVNYLPVGSEAATKWYAEQILDAGVAMVNCMPVFIAKGGHFTKRFTDAGLPLIGDDIKSQVGATISHRVLTTLFQDRGVRLDRTMQLNVGGNSDFLNMLERDRLESKKISKTNAVTSMLDYDIGAENVHVGPSDYVPWLTDRKWAYIRMEGTSFGDVPLNIELKLEVWDSPNSAGIVIDAVRLAKLALNNGIGGPLEAPSSYLMKSPTEADPRRRGPRAHRALHQAERAHEGEGGREGVTRVRLSRIFWIGAAATLVVAALIGVAGLLRSEFTETDGRILLTLLTLLVAGGAALAGLALVERSSFVAFGWLATVVAVASFVLITAATWRDYDDDLLTKLAGIAAVTLIAVLLASTQILLHRGRLQAVVVSTWLTMALAVSGTAIGIARGRGRRHVVEGRWKPLDPRCPGLAARPRPSAFHGSRRIRDGSTRSRGARRRRARGLA